MGTRVWDYYHRHRNTIAFLILAIGMGIALWREGTNRAADADDARRADAAICVAFDVLKANYLATLLTIERDFPPAGREQEFSDTVRALAAQVQIVDCGKLVKGFEDLQIVVTIPPPPTTTVP